LIVVGDESSTLVDVFASIDATSVGCNASDMVAQVMLNFEAGVKTRKFQL
jgi:hypothetical protein